MDPEVSEIVYISGPSYCPEERWSMSEIAEALGRSGYDTYLPSRDGIEGLLHGRAAGADLLGSDPGSYDVLRRASFALETFQIMSRCDSLVFNMNGRVPDGGGVFKTALAFSAGKPLVLYKRDHRSAFAGRDNSMITGLAPTFSAAKRKTCGSGLPLVI